MCSPPTLTYTQTPTATVGDGTPASCTFAALQSAVTTGGYVKFSCGPQPVTIAFTATINLVNDVTVDGGMS